MSVSFEAPNLAGLLLHSANKSLVGHELRQFMYSSEDWECYKAQIGEAKLELG